VKLDGIEGRVAFVTGGGRGIGRAIAETLRDQGARVADGDLRAPEIDGVLGVELDVTSVASIEAAFARIEGELGAVELLVLNAGIFVVEPFEETSPESWRRTIDVNLTGAFLCARRALPSIASEYAEHGITANALAPALIDTEMITGIADLVNTIPVGRLGRTEEVAAAVAYLCSTPAAYITGAVVDVNGGFLIA
jgi:NAD(P)-dependent dehydrogenase (short-subunit alcohol dehydrogenase family)